MGPDVRRLRVLLSGLLRAVFTPRAVRDIEDAGPDQEAATLPPPPPAGPDEADEEGLREMGERLERIRRRNQELARLYERRRGGG